MGEPRGLNMAQTLQSAHTMRGGKLSEHAALQWGDVERRAWKICALSSVPGLWSSTSSGAGAPSASAGLWRMPSARVSQTATRGASTLLDAGGESQTEVATLIFSDITTGAGGSGANTYSTEEAAFFSGEDTEALAAVVGVPELPPGEMPTPSAPPRPSAAPAPSAPPQPSAPPRPSAPPAPAGPPEHIKLRFEQILSERKIPLETAMIYLRGGGGAPQTIRRSRS